MLICHSFAQFDRIFQDEYQENLDPSIRTDVPCIFAVEESLKSYTIPCEFSPGKFLHVNANLTKTQQEKLLKVLEKQTGAFAWEYTDMKGIHPDTCVHHIYIDNKINPVRQPQRRMNPSLKDIVKEELQKLLNAGFIYPISDSKWVYPLVC